MKFKDVAHLYIGCKVKSPITGIISDLSASAYANLIPSDWGERWKPLLYPLSAMTREQHKLHLDLLEEIGQDEKYGTFFYGSTPESWKYLLDNHFDLFNLIESGEAIDVTTLETNPYKEVPC